MIALAALDIAGTTIDDRNLVYDALRDCVLERDVTVRPRDLTANMGREKRTAIRALFSADHRTASDDEVEQVYARFVELLDDYYRLSPPIAFAGVETALAQLRERGVKVALTTGFTRDVALQVLSAVGWRVGEQVDALVCGDEVPAGRPAPYLIHHAMQRTGVEDVREVLAAGDTGADLLAGTRSGASLVVGVLTGGVSREVLAQHPHTHLLDSVVDVTVLI